MSINKWINFFLYYQLLSVVPAATRSFYIRRTESHLVSGRKLLKPLLLLLNRASLFQFQQFIDLAVYDQPGKTLRFTLLYQLLSIHYNARLTFHLQTNELTPVDSITQYYPSAG